MPLPLPTDFTGPNITEAQFKTAMTDLINHIAETGGVPVGALVYFKRTTAPNGFLKANGAAVLRSAYSALDAAIYCGDTNNATAESCYRCTNPASPSTSRSTTGAYLVLPDERGEFQRGWDDGRGIDVERSLYVGQGDQNKSHSHTGSAGSDGAHTHTTEIPKDNGVDGSSIVVNGNRKFSGYGTYTSSSSGAHTHTLTINTDGGTEARVRNNAWLACIKY